MAHAHKKKGDLPGWFPFALGASLAMTIFAGSRSGWKLSGADKPPPPPPTPPGPPEPAPPVQAGILRDWAAGDYRI